MPLSYGIPWKWKFDQAQSITQKRNTKMISQKNRLENDIASLEKRLDEDNLSETEKNQILDELAARKLQREEMSIHKTKGAIIRWKARWYNEGEKNEKVS